MKRLAARLILRAASFLVPRRMREDWYREWAAELWYAESGVLAFAMGSVPDAALLRLRYPLPAPRELIAIDTAGRCLVVLGASAVVAVAVLLRLPEAMATLALQPMVAHAIMLITATIVLASMGMIRFDGPWGWRRTAFLTGKLLLVAVAATVGSLDAGVLLSRGPLQPHAALLGYIVGFRWALSDQTRRCPVCLRRLEHPIRMGAPSSVFLDWYGTEYVCPKGHGLMHVPELVTASYRARNWLALDPSWRSLFQ